MRRALLITIFTILVSVITQHADSNSGIEQTLREHEQRLATTEERSLNTKHELERLDDWYDGRINNMEKYYNAKIEQQQQIDTRLLSMLDTAKTILAFAAGVISLFFGYIGIRNILAKKTRP